MVLAFLQGEIDSPRFGSNYVSLLASAGATRTALIDDPDLDNVAHNATRRQLLADVRGYGRDQWLFRGFPAAARWRRVRLERADGVGIFYANHPTWRDLSGGTRSLLDGARNV